MADVKLPKLGDDGIPGSMPVTATDDGIPGSVPVYEDDGIPGSMPVEAPNPDNIWTGKVFTPAERSRLATKYGKDEADVRMYVATKGGAYDAIDKAQMANSSDAVKDLISRFSTELQKGGSDTTRFGGSREFMNNVLTVVEHPWEWAKGNVPAIFALDQQSGDKAELALKDEIDQMLKGDTNAGRMALQGIVSTALAAPIAKVASPILAPAARAIGKVGGTAVSGVTNLATRLGVSEGGAQIVGRGLSEVGKFAGLATKVGALTGATSALLAPRGEKVEAGTAGALFGAGLIVAGAGAAGIAAGSVAALKLGKGLMTRQLDNFGEKAVENLSKRAGEESTLLNVTHGKKYAAQVDDTTGLANVVAEDVSPLLDKSTDELRAMSAKLGINPSVAEGLKRNKSFINTLGIQTVGEEIAEKTKGVAEKEAKLEILMDYAGRDIDPGKLRTDKILLKEFESRNEIAMSATKMRQAAENVGIPESRILKTAKSSALQEDYAMEKGMTSAEMNKLIRTPFNKIPDATRTELVKRAVKSELELYTAELAGTTKGDTKMRRELLNLSKAKMSLFNASDEYLDTMYDNATKVLKIPPSRLRVVTNRIIRDSKENIGMVVEKLSPSNLAKIEHAAERRAIELFGQKEYMEFAGTWLPTLMNAKAQKLNLPELFGKLDSKKGLMSALDSFDWIPKAERAVAEDYLQMGNWQLGAKHLEDWAAKVTKGRKLSEIKLDGLRKFVDKTTHEMGQDPGFIENAWMQFRMQREMGGLAKEWRSANRGRSQGIWDQASKYILGSHVNVDDITRRYGFTDLGIRNLNINNKLEKISGLKEEIGRHLSDKFHDKIESLQKSSGLDRTTLYKFLDGDTTVKFENAAQRDAAVRIKAIWKETTDYLRNDIAKGYGVKILERTDYVPHRIMTPDEAVATIRVEISRFEKEAGRTLDTLDNAELKAAMEIDSFKDMVKSIEYSTGATIEDARSLREALSGLGDIRRVSANLMPQLAATKRRAISGELPFLIREKNLRNLTDTYTNQLLRNAFLREDITDLYAKIDFLDKLGAESYKRMGETGGRSGDKITQIMADAAYLREYTKTVAGYGSRGYVAEKFMAPLAMRRARKMAEKFKDDPIKFEMALNAPKYMGEIISNVTHSALLSRPLSTIKNLTQLPVVTGAEFGGGKGVEIGMNSMLRAAGGIARNAAGEKVADKRVTKLLSFMEENGMLPKSKIREASIGTKGSLVGEYKQHGVTALGAEMSRRWANILLTPFGMAEKINRVGTALHVDSVIELVKLRKLGAEEAFGKIVSPDVKTLAMNAVRDGKLDDVGFRKTMYNYALQKTQFVYSDLQKAKFIKDAGPLFGMFLRYGSESTGIMYNKIKAGKLDVAVEDAVRPLIWLSLGQKYIEHLEKESEGFKARKSALFGRSSIRDLAPVVASAQYLTGGIVPVSTASFSVGMIGNMMKAAVGDEKAAGAVVKTAIEIVPGVTLAESIIDDMWGRMIRGEMDATPVRNDVKEVRKAVSGKWKDIYNVGGAIDDLLDVD